MKKLNLTDKRKPDYFYSEAIKTLRTNIQLSGQSIKTILVTSCFPNEGKSDVVLSLAQELGSIGKKVLLLDADIRKTAYAGRLGVEEEVKGLSQLLSGQVGLQDIIYETNFPNMDIIFGGPAAPNPSGLLSENIFRVFLKEVREYYNYILIDTPPIGTVIDAAVIGRCCDGAIFLIQPGSVRYRDAQKAFAQLERSGCRVLGAVMNKIDTSGDKLSKIHHIAIIVSDYEAAKDFYVNKLGLSVIRENYRPERKDWKLDLRVNEHTELEIFAEENPPKRVNRPEACGLRHLAFCVESVEQTVNELAEVGIECEPIRVDDYTGKKMTFFHDPDGLPLELHE